jgi:aldose 1-epimerase
VERNSNRIGGAQFALNGKTYTLEGNDNGNNLHSGDCYCFRMWKLAAHTESSVSLTLESPNGDQGFPGNAKLKVTYTLEYPDTLRITYDGVCDQDTVFNMTNHSYFNLAGHEKTDKAMDQILSMGARTYTVADAQSIPTGEMRPVDGTPMDFRTPKPIGRDIDAPYEALCLQGGYDHNYEAFCNPCAILSDPVSGRTMSVVTDCPGIQLYTANFLDNVAGKSGICYVKRSGVCLETQYYPDAINHPEWAQPVVKAGEQYHSETKYIFS